MSGLLPTFGTSFSSRLKGNLSLNSSVEFNSKRDEINDSLYFYRNTVALDISPEYSFYSKNRIEFSIITGIYYFRTQLSNLLKDDQEILDIVFNQFTICPGIQLYYQINGPKKLLFIRPKNNKIGINISSIFKLHKKGLINDRSSSLTYNQPFD